MECWGWEELKAVRDDRFLLILDARTNSTRAFELDLDRGEVDPITPIPPAARPLEEALMRFAARPRARESPGDLDAATLARLRALGYAR
jgi:hypothetical protein